MWGIAHLVPGHAAGGRHRLRREHDGRRDRVIGAAGTARGPGLLAVIVFFVMWLFLLFRLRSALKRAHGAAQGRFALSAHA
jgi:hypothetical protein